MCLLQPHDRLHRGDALETGVKYLMRTDVMYLKEGAKPTVLGSEVAFKDQYPADDTAAAGAVAEIDDAYIEASSWLQKASLLESQGQYEEAIMWYDRAYKRCPRLDPKRAGEFRADV